MNRPYASTCDKQHISFAAISQVERASVIDTYYLKGRRELGTKIWKFAFLVGINWRSEPKASSAIANNTFY
jgi:hypothetical protein